MRGQKGPVAELVQAQMQKAKVAMDELARAEEMARNINNPDRRQLATHYVEVRKDPHFTSVWESRLSRILSQELRVVRADGSLNDEATSMLRDAMWLEYLVRGIMETELEGYVVLDLSYLPDKVAKVPFENLNPIDGLLYADATQKVGQPLYDKQYATTAIYLGDRYSLGLLRQAAPLAYRKRLALQFALGYSNLMINPITKGKTAGNAERKQQMLEQLTQMGRAAKIVIDQEEEVEFVQPASSDLSGAFFKIVDNSNAEMSKLLLGQTMTTDSGSSQAQANVHLKVMDERESMDLSRIERIFNTLVVPLLGPNGIPWQKGDRLDYPRYEYIKPEQMQQLGAEFLNRIDVEKQAKKYGIPLKTIDPNAKKTEGSRISEFGVGGLTGMLQLVKDVNTGLIPADSAKAILKNVYGFDDKTTEEILAGTEPDFRQG